MSAENEKPEVDGQEVAKHTTREDGVWVIIHSASLVFPYRSKLTMRFRQGLRCHGVAGRRCSELCRWATS